MRLDAPVAAPYWERWSSTSRSPTIPSVSRHGSSMTTLLRPLCPVARSLPSVSSPPLPSCWWGASPRSWPRSPTHGTDGGSADTPSARRPGRRPRARPRRTRRRATGQRGDTLRRIGHELLRSARPCLRSRPCLPGDIPDPSRRLLARVRQSGGARFDAPRRHHGARGLSCGRSVGVDDATAILYGHRHVVAPIPTRGPPAPVDGAARRAGFDGPERLHDGRIRQRERFFARVRDLHPRDALVLPATGHRGFDDRGLDELRHAVDTKDVGAGRIERNHHAADAGVARVGVA